MTPETVEEIQRRILAEDTFAAWEMAVALSAVDEMARLAALEQGKNRRLLTEVEKLRADVERLRAAVKFRESKPIYVENQRLRAEVERLRAQVAAVEAVMARPSWPGRYVQLDDLRAALASAEEAG